MRAIAAAAMTVLIAGAGPASARDLAADGANVRLSIADSFRCGPEAPITVTSASADYFDQDADTLQRLANTARAVLAFECSRLQKIVLFGYTNDVLVFKAVAEKKDNWSIMSDPAPLEALALFFSKYEPDFYYLGVMNAQVQPYLPVKGMFGTFQFEAYKKQAIRMMDLVDGDLEKFRQYLRNPSKDLGTFDDALKHYNDILAIIKAFSPNRFPAYKGAYDEVSLKLKDDFWQSRLAPVFAESNDDIGKVVAKAKALAVNGGGEFKDFVDQKIAGWVGERSKTFEQSLGSSDAAGVRRILAAMPARMDLNSLPKSAAAVKELESRIPSMAEKRLQSLYVAAFDQIQAAKTGYSDVDRLLEIAVANAGMFEKAGFDGHAKTMLADAAKHIEAVLAGDLKNYKDEIGKVRYDAEGALHLQQQAVLFAALKRDLPGFAAYQDAAEAALTVNKTRFCEGMLQKAGVEKKEYAKKIFVGSEPVALAELACTMFENGHIFQEFSSSVLTFRTFVLGIQDKSGVVHRFKLKSDDLFSRDNLRIEARLDDGQEIAMTEESWHAYMVSLSAPPPTGKPDAKGVRECDKLAADPYDSGKLTAGIDFNKTPPEPEVLDRAIDACIAAVEDDPGNPRQKFQLGRLLLIAGDTERAGQFLGAAAETPFAPAQHYQAELLLASSEDPDAFIDALNLFKAASDAGYAPAAAMAKQLNPQGLEFFKELPPPTAENVLSALERKNFSVRVGPTTTSANVVNVEIRQCFQINATDFSCEYKPVLKCDFVGSNMNGGMQALLSRMMQADCDSANSTFNNFRKSKAGKWSQITFN